MITSNFIVFATIIVVCPSIFIASSPPSDSDRRQAVKYQAKGTQHFKNNELEDALKNYQKAHQLDPTEPLYASQAATILLNTNQLDEAIKYGLKSLELVKKYPQSSPLEDKKRIAATSYVIGLAHLKKLEKDSRIHARKYLEMSIQNYATPDAQETLDSLNQMEKLWKDKQEARELLEKMKSLLTTHNDEVEKIESGINITRHRSKQILANITKLLEDIDFDQQLNELRNLGDGNGDSDNPAPNEKMQTILKKIQGLRSAIQIHMNEINSLGSLMEDAKKNRQLFRDLNNDDDDNEKLRDEL